MNSMKEFAAEWSIINLILAEGGEMESIQSKL